MQYVVVYWAGSYNICKLCDEGIYHVISQCDNKINAELICLALNGGKSA